MKKILLSGVIAVACLLSFGYTGSTSYAYNDEVCMCNHDCSICIPARP